MNSAYKDGWLLLPVCASHQPDATRSSNQRLISAPEWSVLVSGHGTCPTGLRIQSHFKYTTSKWPCYRLGRCDLVRAGAAGNLQHHLAIKHKTISLASFTREQTRKFSPIGHVVVGGGPRWWTNDVILGTQLAEVTRLLFVSRLPRKVRHRKSDGRYRSLPVVINFSYCYSVCGAPSCERIYLSWRRTMWPMSCLISVWLQSVHPSSAIQPEDRTTAPSGGDGKSNVMTPMLRTLWSPVSVYAYVSRLRVMPTGHTYMSYEIF